MFKFNFIEVNKERYNSTTMPAVWKILDEIYEKTGFDEHQIVYIGIYGSQNYRMDGPESDIDCECFIFPSHDDIVFARPLYSKCIETSYGTCHVKDIRAAFNELLKCSPNILEVLGSPYALINKDYEFIMVQICCNYLRYFATLNLGKLMKGLEGLLHRYSKDLDIPKYLANAIRVNTIMLSLKYGTANYFDVMVPPNYEELAELKFSNYDIDELMFKVQHFINATCISDEELANFYEENPPGEFNEGVKGTILFWQDELMTRYIKLEF